MAVFQPASELYIMRVPFDNSYRHTLYMYNDAAEQAQTLISNYGIGRYACGDYTYIRKSNSIKVKWNAEELYTCNYCAFRNGNYGDKWFYAFVVDAQYVNENVTELFIELDVMQTWLFDFNWRDAAVFVERETVASDELYSNRIAEPDFATSYITSYKQEGAPGMFNDYVLCVQTNAKPEYKSGSISDFVPGTSVATHPVIGSMYSGVYSGAKIYIFPLPTTMSDEYGAGGFLNDLNRGGGAESVTNVFMIPRFATYGTTSEEEGWEEYAANMTQTVNPHTEYFPRIDNLGGYVPRNKKLLQYPYMFTRMEDNAGHFIDLKNEDWGYYKDQEDPDAPEGMRYEYEAPFEADASCFVIPIDYLGEPLNMENALVFPCTAKCSWVYSAYQNWAAQNHISNEIAALGAAATLAIGTVGIASGFGASAGAGAIAANMRGASVAAGAAKGAAGYAGTLGTVAQVSGKEIAALGGLTLAKGAGTAIDVATHSMQPNMAKGSASGNSLYGVGKMRFNVKCVCIRPEQAAAIDSFFDVMGYEVDTVKPIEIDTRPSWNYIKTRGASYHGAVPSDDMAMINAIFDNGITFWHDSDIGNYGLPNAI